MVQPDSVEDWLAIVVQHEASVEALLVAKRARNQCMFHVGLAVEAGLKAYIMHHERFNRWPSKKDRPDLYTHNLRDLAAIAKLTFQATDAQGPAWAMLRVWDRNQGYEPKEQPYKVAEAWRNAAFGSNGVVTWIRQQLPSYS